MLNFGKIRGSMEGGGCYMLKMHWKCVVGVIESCVECIKL